MDILYLMIICSVSLAVVFLVIFIVNARRGQFEDDESPAVRILFEDEVKKDEDIKENNKQDLKEEEKSK